jgi:hypothetical protein
MEHYQAKPSAVRAKYFSLTFYNKMKRRTKNNERSNDKRKEERRKYDVYLSDTVVYACISHEFVSDL